MKLKNFEIPETAAAIFEFSKFRILEFLIIANDEFLKSWKVEDEEWADINFPFIKSTKAWIWIHFDQKTWNEILPISLFSGKVIPITNQHTDPHPCIRLGWARSLIEWPRKQVQAYSITKIGSDLNILNNELLERVLETFGGCISKKCACAGSFLRSPG